MSSGSVIEWTDSTWNPVVGCSIVSPGCTNCYAMKMAARLEKMNRTGGSGSRYVNPYDGTTKPSNAGAVWTGKVARASDDTLTAPLRWKKPKRIFVNSMGDLFHESVPDEWIDRVFAVMALAPQHQFQVLTKRAERMRGWFANLDRAESVGLAILAIAGTYPPGHRRVPWPLPNVWLGVSAERQQEADERIPHLLATPAAVRFVSLEPLLGPIDLRSDNIAFRAKDAARQFVDWVIVGGESGPHARPMHPEWARSLRDQCSAAGVPYFFKQWGAYEPEPLNPDFMTPRNQISEFMGMPRAGMGGDGSYAMRRVGKKAAGRELDGETHNAMPETGA